MLEELVPASILADYDKFHFDIDATLKEYFLSGQDAISKTLEHQLAIHEFCQADRKKRPWMWES